MTPPWGVLVALFLSNPPSRSYVLSATVDIEFKNQVVIPISPSCSVNWIYGRFSLMISIQILVEKWFNERFKIRFYYRLSNSVSYCWYPKCGSISTFLWYFTTFTSGGKYLPGDVRFQILYRSSFRPDSNSLMLILTTPSDPAFVYTCLFHNIFWYFIWLCSVHELFPFCWFLNDLAFVRNWSFHIWKVEGDIAYFLHISDINWSVESDSNIMLYFSSTVYDFTAMFMIPPEYWKTLLPE